MSRQIVNDEHGHAMIVDSPPAGNRPNEQGDYVPRPVSIGITDVFVPGGAPNLGVEGGTQTLQKGVFRTSFDEPKSITLYALGLVDDTNGNKDPNHNARPICVVTYGLGGTTFVKQIDMTAPGTKFSFVAESVAISVGLQTRNSSGNAIAPTTRLHSSLMLGEGVDPDFRTPTLILDAELQNNTLVASLQATTVASQLEAVIAWDSVLAGGQFLVIWDSADGGVTGFLKFVFPLPAAPSLLSVDFERSPATFANGIWFAVATDPHGSPLNVAAAVTIYPEIVR
jgi:hypothetical protein